jgi:ribonuclease J
VELEAGGARLVLDVGRPLDSAFDDDLQLPDVPGLATGAPDIAGVVISHGHPDHWGLAGQLPPGTPLFAGEATVRVLSEAAFFSPVGADLDATAHLRDGVSMSIGPFVVTPFLVDHSAFDAYALLVECGGRRLFYSGDLRATGRKGGLFERLVSHPPRDVHAVLLEGTQIRDGESRHSPLSESDVEERCARLFEETDGIVLAAYSGQNIDRVVSLYRAAKRTGRRLVLDLYGATIAAATETATIPQPGSHDVGVYVPQAQRIKVKRTGEFERVDAIRESRVFGEDLAADPGKFVLTFRGSMTGELDKMGCLDGASAVWSMWSGYLKNEGGQRVARWFADHDIPLSEIHASGHATVADLQRLAGAFGPARIVPIHTAHPGLYSDLFDGVELHPDGEWWEV